MTHWTPLPLPLVLVVGKSKAGKSRTALEAVRRALPEAELLAPSPEAGALGRLLDLDPPLPLGPGPVVVWLDDLDRYLGVVGWTWACWSG